MGIQFIWGMMENVLKLLMLVLVSSVSILKNP